MKGNVPTEDLINYIPSSRAKIGGNCTFLTKKGEIINSKYQKRKNIAFYSKIYVENVKYSKQVPIFFSNVY